MLPKNAIGKLVTLGALAAGAVWLKGFFDKHTGPGDDILVPEGTKPSWR